MEQAQEYRYPHFQRKMMMEDMLSFRGGPKPGEEFPDFQLTTLDGDSLTKKSLTGDRPVLITIGSVTCPMTASSSPALKKLYNQFRNQFDFITLYVREAHPGDYFHQAETIEQKIEYAKTLKERDRIPWETGVDDINGDLHRKLGGHPNAAYIIDTSGKVAFRILWSNDERAIKKGLESVLAGKQGQKKPKIVPMLAGMGSMGDTLKLSGPTAQKDVLKQAPPMFLMAQLAKAFKPFSPLYRGMAAIGSMMIAFAGFILLKARRNQ
jgi:peroxiredoxin